MTPDTPPTKRRTPDQGSVTAFTAVIVLGLLTVLGLTVDGGLALAAKVRAYGEAEEAARDGARQLDLKQLREQRPLTLRSREAEQAALGYVHAAGATGEARATSDSTTVTVHRTQHTQLLTLIGISTINVTATATAHAEQADIP